MGTPLSDDELEVARRQLKERYSVSVQIADRKAILIHVTAERAFDAVMDGMRHAEQERVADVHVTCRYLGPA
jgi:hypothetical protein